MQFFQNKVGDSFLMYATATDIAPSLVNYRFDDFSQYNNGDDISLYNSLHLHSLNRIEDWKLHVCATWAPLVQSPYEIALRAVRHRG